MDVGGKIVVKERCVDWLYMQPRQFADPASHP